MDSSKQLKNLLDSKNDFIFKELPECLWDSFMDFHFIKSNNSRFFPNGKLVQNMNIDMDFLYIDLLGWERRSKDIKRRKIKTNIKR